MSTTVRRRSKSAIPPVPSRRCQTPAPAGARHPPAGARHRVLTPRADTQPQTPQTKVPHPLSVIHRRPSIASKRRSRPKKPRRNAFALARLLPHVLPDGSTAPHVRA